MNVTTWKKIGIIAGSLFTALYIIFLLSPLVLSPILNSYNFKITDMIERTSGFRVKLDNLQVVTAPNLSAGVKVKHIDVVLPNNDNILSVDNAQFRLALLPVLMRRIQIDLISADSISADLKVQKNGKFLLESYLPDVPQAETEQAPPMTSLPFGIKLSNHLPDINVKNYSLTFVDMVSSKDYTIKGGLIKISDFILDKKIKVSADGQVILDGKTQFVYDVKLFNKLMPDMNLNDLVFGGEQQVENNKSESFINIIDVFKGFRSNQLSAELITDLKIIPRGEEIHFNGFAKLNGITLNVNGKPLPAGHADMVFKGNKISLNSHLYTAANEKTSVKGEFRTGKHPKIDMNFKSNAGLSNIFDVIKSIAKASDIKDLETLSANGVINADFNLQTDMKKVKSNGYLKIPSANINYGLYKVAINNINADISLDNDMINVKNTGFSILGQPLKIYGTITNKAVADMHLLADRLSVKGLLAAAGQLQMLDGNQFNGGTVTVDASVKGKLSKLQPNAYLSVNNLNVVNPMVSFSVPSLKIVADDKNVNIENSYFFVNNSRIDLTGYVKDYTGKKPHIDIKAEGNLLSTDIRSMMPKEMRGDISAAGKLPFYARISGDAKRQEVNLNLKANPSNYVSILNVDVLQGKPVVIESIMKIANDTLKFSDTGVSAGSNTVLSLDGNIENISSNQKLNLKISVPKEISFAIPGFNNSKIQTAADIKVTGHAFNPLVSGAVSVPVLSIPPMELLINNMNINLGGPILNGRGTVKKFKSGGITAENLTSDFSLINNIFYLKNITGDAFSGKVNGNVSYNLADGRTGVNFKGEDMNAADAIAGASGIKNALSGKLAFNANVKLKGVEYNEMVKSLTGKVTFDIKDGTFGNIGRLENFLNAQNILANSIMRAALSSIVRLPVVASTAQFKYISGDLSFLNGWAKLNSIRTSGPSMSYYITGRYNILNGTANMIILGRLSYDVVALLGPIGDLSVEKLTSYLPRFGDLTAIVIRQMTTDPRKENTTNIPALSSGKTDYRDFKVEFNGGIESKTSVKSFKWLSNVDTTGFEPVDLKKQLQDTKNAIKNAHEKNVQDIKDTVNDAKQQLNNAKEDLKNMFKF